jgi:hypothetical protein
MPALKTIGNAARGFGGLLRDGAAGAAATALVSGATVGASHAYNALTKARDFKQMLASPFNDDLKEYHQASPEKFNAAFTSLRTVNPAITKDPMTAGAYMRRVMQFDNAGATGVLLEAHAARERMPLNPMLEATLRGGSTGVQVGLNDHNNIRQVGRDVNRERKILDMKRTHPYFKDEQEGRLDLEREKIRLQHELRNQGRGPAGP